MHYTGIGSEGHYLPLLPPGLGSGPLLYGTGCCLLGCLLCTVAAGQLAGTSGGALALLVLIAILRDCEPRAHNVNRRTSQMSVPARDRRQPCAHGAAPLSARCPAAAGCYQRVSSSIPQRNYIVDRSCLVRESW